MNWLLSPTNVLKLGGAVLLALGLIGVTGITNNISFFNLDTGENVAHLALGVVGLGAGFGIKNTELHRWLVAFIALSGLATGIYGFLLPAGDFMHPNFFGITNLENPADNLLHLIVGIWAAAAAYVNKQPAEAMTPRMAA
ncbi:MAG: hypothetical protein E6I87_06585 [Chloroflexi bacterium]|nr:MAG: hypothetical protein E6I87_06585 [Chloroflexota bacterium]